ncbi:MAG: hypothetical protein ACOVP2_06460 [Armatimonadaceae bacterium]
MSGAYTPGLTVSARTTIIKTRRLPLKGTVLSTTGTWVSPADKVARAELPGIMQPIKVANKLGIEPSEVPALLTVKVGDKVNRGDIVAVTKGMWGLFKSECKSNTTGTVELISNITGNVGVREAPTPIEVDAYIPGKIIEVLDGEGVVIEAHGALIQGIFGIGGERRGEIMMITSGPDQPITADMITSAHAGKIIVGGSNLSGEALRKAHELGVTGIVVGGIVDKDLVDYLGYDIGVAITGHEDIPLTLVLTEGFGTIAMAGRTFNLLKSLVGKTASICGATQIRAGVIRPEVIVADDTENGGGTAADEVVPSFSLEPGTNIRIIREPYFGLLATVTALPHHLVTVGSGAEVRVLEAKLNSTGEIVTVPRANVEIVAG